MSCQQPRDVARAPHIFMAIQFGISEAAGKVFADLVAIEHFGLYAVRQQLRFRGAGDGRFSGAAQAGQPDHSTAMGIHRHAQTQAEPPAPPQQIRNLYSGWGRRFRLPDGFSKAARQNPDT